MRALVVKAFGEPPAVADAPEPTPGRGEALLRLRAAALNPVDLAKAAGRFYLPLPPPPFVAGNEGVGEVVSAPSLAPGTRVWCLPGQGTFGELFTAREDAIAPVPGNLSDEMAAAIGVAGLAGWMPVRHRGALRPGETVLVLGASGIVGQVAVQAAVSGGAGRVVAAARSAEGRERALTLGAHDAVDLAAPDVAGRLKEACAPGADLVIDPVWGAPLVAALGATRPRARVVQIGNASGPTVELPAGPLRGGRIDIRGFSIFSEDFADVRASYEELAAAGVKIDVESFPLADAASAWRRQAEGADGRKLVLIPG